MLRRSGPRHRARSDLPAPIIHCQRLPEALVEEDMEAGSSEVLCLDVGGKTFRVLASTLRRRLGSESTSLLGRVAEAEAGQRALLVHRVLERAGEAVLFFDRCPVAFAAVLDWHRSGGLHVPGQLCQEAFVAELAFWGLHPALLAPCCLRRLGWRGVEEAGAESSAALSVQGPEDPLHPPSPALPSHLPLVNGGPPVVAHNSEDMFSGAWLESFRRRAWVFLEDAQSSSAAKIFSIISVSFVLLSVVALVVGSLPECQDVQGEPHLSLIILEYLVIGWFTFEYVVRLVVTTERWAYVKSPLVIIDLVAIAPFYVEILLWLAGVTNANLSNIKGALLVMRVLRVLRVARILRLARYSNGMKSCGETLKASYREVGMLIIFVATMITMFSTTVYFMEKEVEGTKFVSIPATFWWCIITITTVGYGDIVPQTFGGRMVASLTSVCGVIVLAFPITVIVENFYRYYRKEKTSSPASSPNDIVSPPQDLQDPDRRPSPRVAHGYGMV